MFAQHLLVHNAFVHLHVTLRLELFLASVHVARPRLRKCVHDAVLFEPDLPIKSHLAPIAIERRSVVHALVSDESPSATVCFVTFFTFKSGLHFGFR